jgi:hypothetical protein
MVRCDDRSLRGRVMSSRYLNRYSCGSAGAGHNHWRDLSLASVVSGASKLSKARKAIHDCYQDLTSQSHRGHSIFIINIFC